MKKHYLLILTLLLSLTAQAQDTIVLRNGDIKSVKVTEVSKSQVKYVLWDYQEGPVYVQEASDIFMVKYKNGTKEMYDQYNGEQQQQQSTNQSTGYYGHLKRDGARLYLDGVEINASRSREVLGNERYQTFVSGNGQVVSGGFAILAGVASALGGVKVLLSDNEYQTLAGYALLAFSEIFLTVGIVYSAVGRGRMNWAVNDYNQRGRELSQNLSLSVSPSIVCTPTATGVGYGLGAGVQLHF